MDGACDMEGASDVCWKGLATRTVQRKGPGTQTGHWIGLETRRAHWTVPARWTTVYWSELGKPTVRWTGLEIPRAHWTGPVTRTGHQTGLEILREHECGGSFTEGCGSCCSD